MRVTLIAFLLLFCAAVFGQTVDSALVVPKAHEIFHNNIDKAQRKLLAMRNLPDSVRQAAGYEVDGFQVRIEKDPMLSSNSRITYLRGMGELLNDALSYINSRKFRIARFPYLIAAFNEAMELHEQGESFLPALQPLTLEGALIISRNFAFQNNPGQARSKDLLIYRELQRYPDRALQILSKNPQLSYGDSIILLASKNDPDELYNYAAAPNDLGRRIANHPDPLVRQISKLSKLPTGRQYFPFLDNLYRGKQSMEAIAEVMDDSVRYYKLLVATQVDYAARMARRDTPLVYKTLSNKLRQKAIETFINTVNGLHDEPDPVRFASLAPLSPVEMYYLCVMGDETIYTSSYLGIYNRLFEKMRTPSGDSLLMEVYFDHFKKWVRMAAGYNKLDDFLGRMKTGNATLLMNAFVNGLDRTGDLEDAVDVADSYASIAKENLRKQILGRVQTNLANATAQGNERGQQIYQILDVIFRSADDASVDVSKLLGIPPVYSMPVNLLKNDKGRIIIEQYFYGDKDGQHIFNGFLNAFRGNGWKVTGTDQFVMVSSTKGTPITIFANRPLDETKDLDAEAQRAMNDYMDKNDIQPSIVIHRGHSYYLNSTLEQLASSAKVVILGSCGGYNNLNQVLTIAPEAHIVASKQVGTGLINSGMIGTVCETLRQGKDLNWPAMWKSLGKSFADNAQFDDYVPPHKNLGAIFITAYGKAEERKAE